MRKYLLAIIISLTLSLSAFADGAQYNLGVDGVACPYCAYGVEKRLLKIESVAQVEVDIGASLVRVTLADNATLSEERAREAVEEAGFTLKSFTPASTSENPADEAGQAKDNAN